MTTPFWHSPLALVVPHLNQTHKASGPLSQVSSDFLKPFTADLWIGIVALFLFSGVFYAIIEPMNVRDFEVSGVPTSLYNCAEEIIELTMSAGGFFRLLLGYIRTSTAVDSKESITEVRGKLTIYLGLTERLQHKRDAMLMHLRNLCDIIFHSIFLGFCLVCGANVWQPSTRAGKVFTLGVSMFSVVVIATYTANLAVFLGNKPDVFAASTLEDFRLLANQGIKVC
jgi:hypothetical protein